MKLKIKHTGSNVHARDARRSKSLTRTLTKFSIKTRRRDEESRGEAPAKRDSLTVATPTARVTITGPVNKIGNRIGMHNAENPPDSERMRKIRAMRKIYNKQMPTLACNSCAYASSCPQFKAGYECAFNPFLNSHKVETPEDLMNYMQDLVAANFRRAQQATIMETLSGGAPSLELTESLAMLFNMTRDLHDKMSEEGTSVTVETEDDSIIRRLFGSSENLLGETRKALKEPIEVSAVVERVMEVGEGVTGDGSVNSEVIGEVTQSELAKSSKKGNGTIQIATMRKI